MQKNLIILATLGLPGSGKTHFSRFFAQKNNFFHINSDHIRHKMFDYPQYTEEESIKVFSEMEHIAEEKLANEISIIWDANSTRRIYRQDLDKLAKKNNAKFFLLWFKCDVERALQGIKKRKEIKEQELKKHHVTLDEDIAKWLVSNVSKKIEEPFDEPYIELDAHKNFDELISLVEQKIGLKKIKAIIFDWHGVLDITRLRHALAKLGEIVGKKDLELREDLRPLIHPWHVGKLKEDTFWSKVQEIYNLSKDQITGIRNRTTDLQINQELWNYLSELKKKYKIGLLSNVGETKSKIIRNKVNLSIFDEIRFSAEVGKDKSEDEFYLELARALNSLPQETLFVDDTVKFIEKAKNLGFITYLFGDIDGLKRIINQ